MNLKCLGPSLEWFSSNGFLLAVLRGAIRASRRVPFRHTPYRSPRHHGTRNFWRDCNCLNRCCCVTGLALLLLWLKNAAATPTKSSFLGEHMNLTQIPASATKVSLRFKHISQLPGGAFSHLQHCTDLDLSHNRVSYIDTEAFTGLSSLQRLDLRNNEISSLPPGVFSPLKQCTALNVSSNMITAIEDDTFAQQSLLVELDLSLNYIRVLGPHSFRGLVMLKVLYLQENDISFLPRGVFTGLTQLNTLHLDSNQISSLDNNTFQGLYSLERLSMVNNPMRELEWEWFATLPRSLALGLSSSEQDTDMSWNCDSLCWLKQEEMAGTITWHAPGFVGYSLKCTQGSWSDVYCSKLGESNLCF